MSLHPPKRPPDDEQRIIVLSCLKYLSPCTELQLLQFLFEYDCMNYFDMMFALNDLCDRGQAVRSPKKAGFQYTLTEAGQEALRLFGGRVPRSMQALLAEHGEDWRRRFALETQYTKNVTQTPRGEWELTLSVTEQDMDMMRLTLSLPDRELAAALAEKWPEKAGKIYETVIRLLNGEDA